MAGATTRPSSRLPPRRTAGPRPISAIPPGSADSINPAERKEKEFDYGFRSAGAPGAALAELCLRGRFQVDDPAAVKHLVLSLTYRGGVVVYLNGVEVTRGHLPKNGALSTDTYADAYPREAFLKSNGQAIQVDHGDPKSNAEGLAKRLRTLPPIEIPPGFIRKGVNVLALEFHRTHYQGNGLQKEGLGYRSVWSTCGLVSAELRAEGGAQPSLPRPTGVQVWVASPMSRTRPWQWADPPRTAAADRHDRLPQRRLHRQGRRLVGCRVHRRSRRGERPQASRRQRDDPGQGRFSPLLHPR